MYAKLKMSSYWLNDLFTLVKVNGPAIIVQRKRKGKVYARNIPLLKKYKHISESEDHSDTNRSSSAGMNKENTLSDNKGSNTDKT